MPEVKKSTAKGGGPGKAIVVEKVDSHANDPFVVKKVARAKEMVSKLKFSDSLMK